MLRGFIRRRRSALTGGRRRAPAAEPTEIRLSAQRTARDDQRPQTPPENRQRPRRQLPAPSETERLLSAAPRRSSSPPRHDGRGNGDAAPLLSQRRAVANRGRGFPGATRRVCAADRRRCAGSALHRSTLRRQFDVFHQHPVRPARVHR